MRALSLCRTAASVLHLSGSVLKTSARVTSQLADAIAGDRGSAPEPFAPAGDRGSAPEPIVPAPAAADVHDGAVRSGSTASAAVAGEGHDMAALAKRPADEVVNALSSLSDAELAELDEVERRLRRRPQVLAAIEDAARPATTEAERALAALREDEADVREPDRLVYSTETPS